MRDSIDPARWQSALLRELDYMASQVGKHQVTSIFFGGGTPSLMPASIAGALIERVHKLWPVSSDIEITLEANPTSIETSTFADFKNAGINRVSLGVQSLRDDELKFLGRGHNAREAVRAIESARTLFDRYTFDLIYARPQQTPAAWEAELNEALQYAGSHLSLYQLTIEENTAFHHAYSKGGFTLPNEEESETLYRLTEEMLASRGLIAYEVSNYAKPGEESRHNLAYWKGVDYIGIGPGAHGRIGINSSRYEPAGSRMEHSSRLAPSADGVSFPSRIATSTLKSPERWLENVEHNGHAIEVWQEIDKEREAQERVMMGLRLREGIAYDTFREQTGFELADYINASHRNLYIRQGLLADDATRLQATLAGRLVLNRLTAELLN